MRCQRCRGRMSYEKFFSDTDSFWGFRCISCGEIIDEGILQNRTNGFRRPGNGYGPRAPNSTPKKVRPEDKLNRKEIRAIEEATDPETEMMLDGLMEG